MCHSSAVEADSAAARAQNDAILDTFGRADAMLAMAAASSALAAEPEGAKPSLVSRWGLAATKTKQLLLRG